MDIEKGHVFSKKDVVKILGLTAKEVKSLTKKKLISLKAVTLQALYQLQLFVVLCDFGLEEKRAAEIAALQHTGRKAITIAHPPKYGRPGTAEHRVSRPGKEDYMPRDILGISGILEMRCNKNAIEKLVRKKIGKMS